MVWVPRRQNDPVGAARRKERKTNTVILSFFDALVERRAPPS
jgi:hypothetical protein